MSSALGLCQRIVEHPGGLVVLAKVIQRVGQRKEHRPIARIFRMKLFELGNDVLFAADFLVDRSQQAQRFAAALELRNQIKGGLRCFCFLADSASIMLMTCRWFSKISGFRSTTN